MTTYLRPRDLDEATVARAAYPNWMMLAGGTDLMVNANHKPVPGGILDLWRLGEIGFIRVEDGAIAIGANASRMRRDISRDERSPVEMSRGVMSRGLMSRGWMSSVELSPVMGAGYRAEDGERFGKPHPG